MRNIPSKSSSVNGRSTRRSVSTGQRGFMRKKLAVRARAESAHDADGVGRARLGLDAPEERRELVAVERLLLEQRRRDAVERGPVLADEPHRLVMGAVGQTPLLAVAQSLRLLRQRVVVG